MNSHPLNHRFRICAFVRNVLAWHGCCSLLSARPPRHVQLLATLASHITSSVQPIDGNSVRACRQHKDVKCARPQRPRPTCTCVAAPRMHLRSSDSAVLGQREGGPVNGVGPIEYELNCCLLTIIQIRQQLGREEEVLLAPFAACMRDALEHVALVG